MKSRPSKDIKPECWLESCRLKATHVYQFGNKEIKICSKHYKAFMKQKQIEEAKKKDGKK